MENLFRGLWTWWVVVLAFGSGAVGHAQEFNEALDRLPQLSAALLKALEGTPAFLARSELEVTHEGQLTPTVFNGACTWRAHHLRFDVNARSLRSPLVTPQMQSAIYRLNLPPISLLARGDTKSNHVVLNGVKAVLDAPMPVARLRRPHGRTTLAMETIGGQKCAREKFSVLLGREIAEVTIWKPAVGKDALPVQLRVKLAKETAVLKFSGARAASFGDSQFQVPAGFDRYTNIEDLLPSLLLDHAMSKFGLGGKK